MPRAPKPMTHHLRRDMKDMTLPELVRGAAESVKQERALMESGKYPRGSVRLAVQTENFLTELLGRVSPPPEPSWPDIR